MKVKEILKISSENIEKRKILFQFALMILAACVGGVCFTEAVAPYLSFRVGQRIVLSFSAPAFSEFKLIDFIYKVIKSCLPYFISVGVVLVFSFSYVSYVISDIVLAINGFYTGMLITLVNIYTMRIQMASSVIFIICIATSLLILFCFTYYCALFSLNVRMRVSAINGRMALSLAGLLLIIIKTLAVCGTFIALAFIRNFALLF